jgi:hypothetical protein
MARPKRRDLVLAASGSGSVDELADSLPQSEVTYAYLRVSYGENDRAKFVFVTSVPDTLSGMAKAKCNMHKPIVEKFLQVAPLS